MMHKMLMSQTEHLAASRTKKTALINKSLGQESTRRKWLFECLVCKVNGQHLFPPTGARCRVEPRV
eukprot:scaffold3238_cov91-Cylindrotheca_fusiformis.AAC.6